MPRAQVAWSESQRKALGLDLLFLLHLNVHTSTDKLRCSLFLQLLLKRSYATDSRAERYIGRCSCPFGAALTM